MNKKELAIKYFESNRKIFCEHVLKDAPKDSIAYHATLQEQEFYDMAIEALNQLTSDDCISRQAVLDKKQLIELPDGQSFYCIGPEDIEDIQSVKPTRKVGYWIIDDKENRRIWHCHCSNCKKDPQDYIGGTENWWLVRLPDYCPNCGSYNGNRIENKGVD